MPISIKLTSGSIKDSFPVTLQWPSSLIPHPICAACQYSKGRHQSHKSHDHSIRAQATKPGDGVSADQLTASAPGIVSSNRGKPTTMKLNYCNVWIDHATSFVYVTFHATNDAKELLRRRRPLVEWNRRAHYWFSSEHCKNNPPSRNGKLVVLY
mmetsp:Transcript_5221/g.7700  ORF Transcript_5221/g.7700 Transcript_5221/m.7700 type:complete len:154 (-) Transcript_5221:523-984(-)